MSRKPPKNAYPPELRAAAFSIWLNNGRPDWRGLEKLVAEKTGQRVSHNTLHRWSQDNAEWAEAVQESEKKKPETILAALASAKADANQLEPDHFMGIKAQLVGRLYDSIKNLPLSNIDDWTRALDCCDKIEAYVHAERGKTILEKNPGVVTSLMERLAPNVSIAPFKKPNGNGAV